MNVVFGKLQFVFHLIWFDPAFSVFISLAFCILSRSSAYVCIRQRLLILLQLYTSSNAPQPSDNMNSYMEGGVQLNRLSSYKSNSTSYK